MRTTPFVPPSSLALLRRMADADPGWVSVVQLSWDVAGDDDQERRDVRHLTSTLHRQGVWQAIFARHRAGQLMLVRVDRDALEAWLDELED